MKNVLMRSEAGLDKRCSWVNVDDPLLLEYHDREWPNSGLRVTPRPII
jgi:hypothetical protein